MRIEVFNVGHGQCAVITAPNGRRMMLDCGDRWGDSAVARAAGMSEAQIATITSGHRPVDLSEEARTAYDVAAALLNGGVLTAPAYQRAIDLFGQPGVNELIYLVGHYCFVSITLNGFDIPVPDGG